MVARPRKPGCLPGMWRWRIATLSRSLARTVARTLTRNLAHEALARRTIGALAQLRRVVAQVGPVEQRVYRARRAARGLQRRRDVARDRSGRTQPYKAGEDVPLAADDAHALVAHAAGEEERRASGRAERLRGKVEERAAADKLARVVELYDKREARLVDVPAEARLHARPVANDEDVGHHEVSDVDAKRGRKSRQEPAPKRPQEELVGTRQQVELGVVRRVRDVALRRPRKVGSAHLGEQLLSERFVQQLDDGDALKRRRPV